MEFRRYAIYAAPKEGTALARAAAAWLGRDQAGGEVARPDLPDLPDLPHPLAQLTEAPQRYGFHATLKAPFRLAPGATREALEAAMALRAQSLAPIAPFRLELRQIGTFLALVPARNMAELSDLAAAVVAAFEPLRAPLTAQDWARRQPDRLSQRQRALLDLWGYPYVMEEFRFHMTLSGPLDTGDQAALRKAAQRWFAPALQERFVLDALCLFGETPEGIFHALGRFPLNAG